MMMVEITIADIPTDLPRIRECRKYAFPEQRPLMRWEQSFVNADAAEKGGPVIVVVKERVFPWRVLGTADVRIREDNTAYITNVFVRPDQRGLGIGKKLMAGVEEIVVNVSEVSLEVTTQNTAAVKLYRRCGYSTPGIHRLVTAFSNVVGLNLLVRMTKEPRI
jgi:ribosomal protein S18 acetylase RimI-like enzyme